MIFAFHCRRRRDQQGYIMVLLVLMVTLVLIALAAELPAISAQLRRDREEELIHRGAQYARAIKKYYRKFGNYPVTLEQLENTNHLRFLRKRYQDPMTGKDFRLLHLGDVQLSIKAPGMSTGPGVAPATGTQPASAAGQQSPTSSTSPFVSLSQMGAKGPAFGGGPIIGVASTSEKHSFHVFNNKDVYKDWEFIYDPTTDRGGLITGPYNGTRLLGGGQVPGALTPAQMQGAPAGANPLGTGGGSPFSPGGSPLGQPPTPAPQAQPGPR